jgi:hypothetical protein
MRITGVLIVGVILLFATFGCGVSTSSPDTTSSSGVPLPKPSQTEVQAAQRQKQKFFHAYYRELRSTGVTPSVSHCYVRTMRNRPALLRAAAEETIPPSKILKLNNQLREACAPAGAAVVEEGRSHAQLEKTREVIEESLRPLLESKGASQADIECVNEGINSLSQSELAQITSGEKDPAAVAVMRSIYTECGAQ